MQKKDNAINLKKIILSRIEEAKQAKENNQQKDKAFRTHTNEVRNRISNIADQFNDI